DFDKRCDVLIGWNRDYYEEEAGDLNRELVESLVGRPWPTLPLEDIVILARGLVAHPAPDIDARGELAGQTESPGVSDARQHLQSALNHRGESQARVAWEQD